LNTPEESEFRELLERFDRTGFGVMMRTAEVLLLRGRKEESVQKFREFVDAKISVVTIDDSIHELITGRFVEILFDAGYHTIRQLDVATDAELLSHAQVGDFIVARIRRRIEEVKNASLLRKPRETKLEPEWPAPSKDELAYAD
jgi:hypothetical protein